MKKKGKRSRGAVSVFLTMILVPCIIVTCAFGDISRVQLSRAGAASAADLALYSLMAEYDVDLKDYYGLVASSQDIEDFYEKTATYFSGMMDAKGVTGEGSELFKEYLKNLIKEYNGAASTADFLQVEFTEPAKVSAADNAKLGENAALIEDGIVEFMKYRGPVTIVTKVIDRFTDLNLGKDTADVDEDKEIVERKQKYANAEGDLLGAALYTYIAIQNYVQTWKTGNPISEKGYDGLAGELSHIWNDLKGVTELITKYYFADTDSLRKVDFPTYNNANQKNLTIEDVGAAVTQEDGSTIYCINSAMLQEMTQGLDEDFTAVENAVNAIQNNFPQFSSGDNPAVYMLKVQDQFLSGSDLKNLTAAMKKLQKRCAIMNAAMQCVPFPEGDDLPPQWQEQLNNICTEITKLLKPLSESGGSAYIQRVKEYRSCAAEHFSRIKNKSYTFQSSYTGGNETLGSFADQTASRLPELRSELKELVDQLTVVINGGPIKINNRSETVVSLDELVEKASTYHTTRDNWGAAADQYETDYAKEESAAYHGTSSDDGERKSEEMAAQISAEAVSELKQRLVNIRSDFQKLLDALDQFTYGGHPVDSILSADTFVSLGRSAMPSRSGQSLSQNESDAASYFRQQVHPDTDAVFQAVSVNNAVNGNNPDLSVSTPGLYEYLKAQFQGKDINDLEQKKKDHETKMEGFKTQAEDSKEKSQGVENDILEGKGEDLSGGHQNGDFTLGTAISSIAGIANSILTGSGDELRDQLYVCEYIMDMFSYATFNNEGKYKRTIGGENKNHEKKKVKPSEVPLKDEAWDTDDKENIPANQSLTNMAINKQNNKANLAEVEYILYGKPTIDGNLNASFGNIFVIREALDLVSGFVNFYSGSKNDTAKAIQAAAAAISTATCGVVPVSVAKCTLIVVLATMEAAHDLYLLKRGFPVEFYKKSDKDWTCAFHRQDDNSGEADRFSDGDDDQPGKTEGMYYSDYMYLFLMLGLTTGSDGIYKDMLLRVGDVIEANMIKSGKESFDLSKSICYFHLKAKVRVKPLMLTLPIVNSMDGVDPSDLLENRDWCTYDVDIYRGYS